MWSWESSLATGFPPPQPLLSITHPDRKAALAPPGPGHRWGWTAVNQGLLPGRRVSPFGGSPLHAGAAQVPPSSQQPPPGGSESRGSRLRLSHVAS